jgi:hypothetical protein
LIRAFDPYIARHPYDIRECIRESAALDFAGDECRKNGKKMSDRKMSDRKMSDRKMSDRKMSDRKMGVRC